MDSNTTRDPTNKDLQDPKQVQIMPTETVTHTRNADTLQEKPSEQHKNCHDRFSEKLSIAALLVSFIAAIAAVFAAYYACEQVDVAKDTAQKELRAYVYAVPGKIHHLGISRTQGYLAIRNGGKTFATNVKRWAGINLLGPEMPKAIDDLGELSAEPGAMTLGPESSTNTIIRTFRVLTDEEVSQIESGDKRIYVFGGITYEDMFGLPHKTTFCFMYYGPEKTSTSPGYDVIHAKYCDEHNNAD